MKPLLCQQPDEFAFEMTGYTGQVATAFTGLCHLACGIWTAKIVFQTKPLIQITAARPLKSEAVAEAMRRALLQQFDPPAEDTCTKAP